MIKDSGIRREFETGAVRDIQEGKGRCDLMPLDVVSHLLWDRTIREEGGRTTMYLSEFTKSGDTGPLKAALACFANCAFGGAANALLEVSVHFEEGAAKYGEHNWQNGLPASCYIDSAVRHLLKYLRGDDDERHDRATMWNLMCCYWTCIHKPELNDYRKSEGGNE